MSETFLTEPVMRAFSTELQKEAAPPAAALLGHLRRPGTLNAIQGGLGAGFGLGLGAGALAGGASSGVHSYQDARAQGATRTQAGLHALAGGLGGAVRGAGKGALIGAAGGAALGAAAPTKAIGLTRGISKLDNSAGGLSRFGQRQVHSLTGWKPGGSSRSIESIGAGAADARKRLEQAVAKGAPEAEVGAARAALGASEEAQRMGLTSLPGIARSVSERGLLPTIGAGVKDQWSSSPGWSKALMLGMPAASVAKSMTTPEVSGQPGRGERIGRTLGGALGYSMAPLSLAGGTVLGVGLERAGGLAGRGVDRLRGRRPQVPQEASRPPASEPGDTGQVATERVFGTGYGGSAGME